MPQVKDAPMTGWKALRDLLQSLISVINTNEPIAGAGLRSTTIPGGGTLLELAETATSSPPDATGTTTTGGPTDGFWRTVIIVNPDTCERSTIEIWSH